MRDRTRADEVRTAGRGLLSITASKLYFILMGYSVQLALPRLFGSPELFGLYSSTMVFASIINNVMIQATIQTVSKHTTHDLHRTDQVLRQGLIVQLTLGGVLGGMLLLGGPWLAEAWHNPRKGVLFQIIGLVVLCYGLYAALIGSLNGRQRYQQQAALDFTWSTLRTGGILGAAALGLGVLGSIGAFAGAAVILLLFALAIVGWGRGGAPSAWAPWLRFMAPLWFYHFCLNFTWQGDLLVLDVTTTNLALASDELHGAAAQTAERFAGLYKAVQTFAFVPYQLILSVTFIVFPMVSLATTEGDVESARRYIRGAMRFSLIVLLAVATPIAGSADGVMRIAYPDEYLVGASALAVLCFGMVAFALFVIAATVLNGAGRPMLSASIAGAAGLVVISLNSTLVRMVGIGEHTMLAAACGTTVAMTLALVAVSVTIYLRFGAFIPLATLPRAATAGAVGFLTAGAIPHDSALTALGALVGGGLAYLFTLFVVRELDRHDIEAIFHVLKSR